MSRASNIAYWMLVIGIGGAVLHKNGILTDPQPFWSRLKSMHIKPIEVTLRDSPNSETIKQKLGLDKIESTAKPQDPLIKGTEQQENNQKVVLENGGSGTHSIDVGKRSLVFKYLQTVKFDDCFGRSENSNVIPINAKIFEYKAFRDENSKLDTEKHLRAYLFYPPNLNGTKTSSPEANQKRPILALFDGKPYSNFATALYFASRGLVTVAFQYRDTKPHDMLDMRSAARWLRKFSDELTVEPDRIMFWSATVPVETVANPPLPVSADDESGSDFAILPYANFVFKTSVEKRDPASQVRPPSLLAQLDLQLAQYGIWKGDLTLPIATEYADSAMPHCQPETIQKTDDFERWRNFMGYSEENPSW